MGGWSPRGRHGAPRIPPRRQPARGGAGRREIRAHRFFLSLGDNLLRIFEGDRVAGLVNAFRVEEDMPIESGMLTRSLEGLEEGGDVLLRHPQAGVRVRRG